uniref:Plectin, putative n=1 Tax=Neospora caninum (strain Liverpool) TaxID=572307 RepID=A0A0F7U821_NEOCL|nr:TPA: plectin, putative [Neospora caninum Liverpool]
MAFSPEFLSRLSELGNEYQRLSEDHEKLKGTENQLYEQITQLQNEVGQLKEGRNSLLSENRSLIEKLQRVTQDRRLSVQLTESRLGASETRENDGRRRRRTPGALDARALLPHIVAFAVFLLSCTVLCAAQDMARPLPRMDVWYYIQKYLRPWWMQWLLTFLIFIAFLVCSQLSCFMPRDVNRLDSSMRR